MVLTQPDRPVGRGMATAPGAVKRFAAKMSFPVFQPATLRTGEAEARIREAGADVMVVATYGLILPRSLLYATPQGALNIHASLLPRWRGAAPIQRAILAGDPETGITIMRMAEGLDTGPVLAQRRIPIASDDDTGSLHDKLAELGAQMIVDALASRLGAGIPQDEGRATYAPKVTKEETFVDWSRAADEIERAIRAFRPTPGVTAKLEGSPLKIWRASSVEMQGTAGTLLRASDGSIVVACGRDAIEITELQRAGGKRMSVADFLRGNPLRLGCRFT